MKSIAKIIMLTVGSWFGLDWAADNPMKIKGARNMIDQRIESGYEFALFQFKSYSSEPSQKTKKQE